MDQVQYELDQSPLKHSTLVLSAWLKMGILSYFSLSESVS